MNTVLPDLIPPPPGTILPEETGRFLAALSPRLPTGSTIREIGRSRGGEPLHGVELGRGPLRISITAGAHADEPGGPLAALALVDWLLGPEGKALLERTSWRICPNVNPDGTKRNEAWLAPMPDFLEYLTHSRRELPGDDVEFNYPRPAGGGREPRQENKAVAAFLTPGGQVDLHFSLHGMAFATGAWWLIEKGWVERTADLRDGLRGLFNRNGWGLHDMERHGEKGFHRIAPGFCTTPSAKAMREHFLAAGETDTAALFLPSSMEFAQSLGGDPLCMVSELPLFLIDSGARDPLTAFDEFRDALRPLRERFLESRDSREATAFAGEWGVRPVPLDHHARTIVAAIREAAEFLLHR